MICVKCKKEIPDDSLYCNYCGKKQVSQPKAPSPKRGNGTGSVFQLNGKWTAQITLGYYIKDGHAVARRHRKTGFATKKEAIAYCANYNREEAEARVDPTIARYIETYKSGEYKKLSADKQKAYSYAMDRLKPIAHRKIRSLGIKDLQDVIDNAVSTYYPARDMKTVLSHVYKLAIAEEVVTTNLALHLTLPPLDAKEPEPFTSEEITKLWEAWEQDDKISAYILLMIYTGMMPGELFKTRVENIDIEGHRITGVGLKTKTRRQAEIALPDAIIPVLEGIVNSTKDNSSKILPMNEYSFYNAYYATLYKNGIRKLKPYSCRHTTATALAAKIPPKTLQRVMRHASFNSTQHYIHPDMKEVHEAINKL